MNTFHSSIERFYLALSCVVAMVYLYDVYVTIAIKRKGIIINNKYYSIQKHFGFMVSGIIKLILVFFIISELLNPSLNIGRSAILAAGYLCLSVSMIANYIGIDSRRDE